MVSVVNPIAFSGLDMRGDCREKTLEPIKVIYNPAAAPDRSAARRKEILFYLDKTKIPYDWSETLYHQHAELLAAEAVAAGFRRIAVAGGDGTVNQVINGFMQNAADPELVILPVGTCNDFIRSIPLPADLKLASAALTSSNVKRFDVACIGERYFINAAGIGFDVDVILSLQKSGKRQFINYLITVFQNLFGFTAVHLVIENQGTSTERDVILFVAANGKQFGGGFRIAPKADISDGQLNFMLFRDMPGWKRARALLFFAIGQHHRLPESEVFTADSLSIKSNCSLQLQLEGELYRWTDGELRISVLPKRVAIVLPENV